MADAFLPVQGSGEPDGRTESDDDRADQAGIDVDAPTPDVVDDESRGDAPDPEGDGAGDEGLPPAVSGPYEAPTGSSIDPATLDPD